MQKITRKRQRPSRLRLVLPALLLMILLSAGAVIWLNGQKPAPPAPQPEAEKDLTMYRMDGSVLSSVTLYRGGEKQLTLIKKDGGLVLEGDEGYALRDTAVADLLALSESCAADDILLDGKDYAPASFGLDPAERSARFRYADGTELTLSVGAALPIENPRYYAAVSGQDRLYSVTPDVRDAVSKTLLSIHPVESPKVKSDLVDRIAVSGDVTFDAVRTDEGWQLTAPFSYPLSDTAMASLLDQLDRLRFAAWIGAADSLPLSEYGLSPAVRTLTLTFPETVVTAPDEEGNSVSFSLPGSDLTFALGNAINDTSYYILHEGQVYSATLLTFSFFTRFSLDRYLQPAPVSILPSHLSGVRFELDGAAVSYDIALSEKVLPNNQLEADEYGNVLFEMRITRDGAAVDPDAFVRWYQSLASIAGTQRTAPAELSPGAEPILSVTLLHENSALSRTVTICPGDAVQDILFVNGVSVYRIDKSWRSRLEEAP